MPDVVGDRCGDNKDFCFRLFLTAAAKQQATVASAGGKVSLSGESYRLPDSRANSTGTA
jgi:hypothetical protein